MENHGHFLRILNFKPLRTEIKKKRFCFSRKITKTKCKIVTLISNDDNNNDYTSHKQIMIIMLLKNK